MRRPRLVARSDLAELSLYRRLVAMLERAHGPREFEPQTCVCGRVLLLCDTARVLAWCLHPGDTEPDTTGDTAGRPPWATR